MLAEARGNNLVHGLCIASLRRMLSNLENVDLVILTSYLLHNSIFMIARYEEGGDIPATVSNMFKPGNMLVAEKFVATDGGSCPYCGHDEAFDEHECHDPAGTEGDDEPFTG